MKKQNKQKQVRSQKREAKKKQRTKELQKQKNAYTEVHWDNLNFFDGWKSLQPQELMQCLFKMDVEDWVFEIVKPKTIKQWLELQNTESLQQLLYDTLVSTIDLWVQDTKGFTENLPVRWQYNTKNKNKFISIVRNNSEYNEFTDEELFSLIEKDRSQWFVVVFDDILHMMISHILPCCLSTIDNLVKIEI